MRRRERFQPTTAIQTANRTRPANQGTDRGTHQLHAVSLISRVPHVGHTNDKYQNSLLIKQFWDISLWETNTSLYHFDNCYKFSNEPFSKPRSAIGVFFAISNPGGTTRCSFQFSSGCLPHRLGYMPLFATGTLPGRDLPVESVHTPRRQRRMRQGKAGVSISAELTPEKIDIYALLCGPVASVAEYKGAGRSLFQAVAVKCTEALARYRGWAMRLSWWRLRRRADW